MIFQVKLLFEDYISIPSNENDVPTYEAVIKKIESKNFLLTKL
jgi:hypothetical protein